MAKVTKHINKSDILEKVKELENQIETINNTRRNSVSVFTESTLMEVFEKIEDVNVKLTNVQLENKGLKEKIKELEEDQGEMEDRIYYLERKLYSLDVYTTHNNIEKVATPDELPSDKLKLYSRQFDKNDKNDEIPTDSTNRLSSGKESQDNYIPNGFPINKLMHNTQRTNIEMVRMAGQNLVGKLKQYTIRSNIEMICTPDDMPIEKLKEGTKQKDNALSQEETPVEIQTENIKEIDKSEELDSEKQPASENNIDDSAPVDYLKLQISSRWNNIEITSNADEMRNN